MRRPEKLKSQPVLTVDEAVEVAAAERSKRFRARIDALSQELGGTADLCVRDISDGITAVFFTSMTDQEALRDSVISRLSAVTPDKIATRDDLLKLVTATAIQEPSTTAEVADGVASGHTALFVADRPQPYLIDLLSYVGRKVTAPTTEPTIMGPNDAFSESLMDNISLIRYRIHSPKLTIRELVVGSETRTRVMVVYLKDKATQAMVDEVVHRIEGVDIDGIVDSSYLRSYIAGRGWSPFPLITATERPDRVCSEVLQGRLAVLCDSSPFALIAPTQFIMLFQSGEDAYSLPLQSLLVRIARVIGWLAATMAPALYIAVSSFNPGLLPSAAVLSIQGARRGVPYPPLIEVLIMDVALELLAEASVRLPTNVSGAATVVGGLILGTAASQARLVSNVMIIVVALTAIGTFSLPGYQNQMSWRLIRYVFTLSAAFLGIPGLTTTAIFMIIYLSSLDVLDTPYMSPLAPWRWVAFAKDVLLQPPKRVSARLQKVQRKHAAAMQGQPGNAQAQRQQQAQGQGQSQGQAQEQGQQQGPAQPQDQQQATAQAQAQAQVEPRRQAQPQPQPQAPDDESAKAPSEGQ